MRRPKEVSRREAKEVAGNKIRPGGGRAGSGDDERETRGEEVE